MATTFPVGKQPLNLAFDGATIWVTNNHDGTVTKLQTNDGTNLGTFVVGAQPVGIAFDGASIWTANSGSNSVTKIASQRRNQPGDVPGRSDPLYLAFDGDSIWVTNGMGAPTLAGSKLRERPCQKAALHSPADTKGERQNTCFGILSKGLMVTHFEVEAWVVGVFPKLVHKSSA